MRKSLALILNDLRCNFYLHWRNMHVFRIIMDTQVKPLRRKNALPRKAPVDANWLTFNQLADRWQTHPVTIRRWYHSGKLRGCTFSGRTVRFALADVVKFESEAFSQ
jgi:excisionase family DNA binding protein